MANINLGSIMKKIDAYSRSANGKLRMKKCIERYANNGVSKTGTGDKVITETEMWTAAAKLIGVLRSTAQSYDLPASVMRHFDSLDCSKIYELPDGTSVIYIYFGDDLHRDSLYSDGYDGIDNIVALLNNGYHANEYVYGNWNRHVPIGESFDDRSKETSTYIRSRKDRTGLNFIGQAIRDFNGNYSSDFNVTAVAGEDYI